MTEDHNSISRRNVLAGLGTIGVGGALVGAGTSALFSDGETFEGELVAGELDLKLDWQQLYFGPENTEHYDLDHYDPYGEAGRPYVNAHPDEAATAELGEKENGVQSVEDFSYEEEDRNVGDEDGIDYCEDIDDNYFFGEDQESLVALGDIKPGDCWETTFSLHLCDNPGWVWMGADVDIDESEDHFADEANAKLWYDMDGNNEFSESDQLIVSGSLRDVLEALEDGILLDGDLDGNKYNHDAENSGYTPIALPKIEDSNISDFSQQQKINQLEDGDELRFTHDNGGEEDDVVIELTKVDKKDDGDVVGFDWKEQSDFGIASVEMKGGPGFNFFEYDCAEEGSAETPNNPGGQQAGLSNFTFSYCADGNGKESQKCFPRLTTQFVAFEWCLPIDTGNDVQGTSLNFDLQFYTEQCRHNDNPDPDFP